MGFSPFYRQRTHIRRQEDRARDEREPVVRHIKPYDIRLGGIPIKQVTREELQDMLDGVES